MFGRLNNEWSHVAVYGFAYPMLVLVSLNYYFEIINVKCLDVNCTIKCCYAWNG